MAARQTTLHSQEIINAQLNGKSEEQYIKDVNQIIVGNIRDLFFKSNLNQKQFAAQIGISYSAFERILNNRGKSIKLTTLCKIGAKLGVPIQNIMTEQPS